MVAALLGGDGDANNAQRVPFAMLNSMKDLLTRRHLCLTVTGICMQSLYKEQAQDLVTEVTYWRF